LYKAIESHPNPKEIYVQKLIAEGSILLEYATEIDKALKAEFQGYLGRSENRRKHKSDQAHVSGGLAGIA
jgi:2-oxoglutarate dehydrogenase E1 component